MGYFSDLSKAMRILRDSKNPQVLDESLLQLTNNQKGSQLRVGDEFFDAIGDEVEVNEISKFIREVKRISTTRTELIEQLQRMRHDSIVGSCLELIADDSSYIDASTGMAYWVECKEDSELEKSINDWLTNIIQINNKSWTWAYNIALYGEYFLRTNVNSADAGTNLLVVGDYFEPIPNPKCLMELTLYGRTIGFQYTYKDRANNREITEIHEPDEFIHFIREKEDFEDEDEYLAEVVVKRGNVPDETVVRPVKVKIGSSMIESAIQAYNILELIENMLLGCRIDRSSLYNIFSIEVGNANDVQTNRILSEFKKNLRYKESMQKNKEYRTIQAPVPLGGNVYTPTRNGRGDIKVETVGGNVDIKEIVDVEYFRDKLIAALKVPKILLGISQDGIAGLGQGSATKISEKYARMISKVKATVSVGVKQMVDFKLKTMGKSAMSDKVVVHTSRVESVKDVESTQALQESVQVIEAIITMLNTAFGEGTLEKEDLKSIILVLTNTLTSIPGLTEVFQNLTINEPTEKGEEQ